MHHSFDVGRRCDEPTGDVPRFLDRSDLPGEYFAHGGAYFVIRGGRQ